MSATVVVGCQYGDEGKGKIVDLMSRSMDWVARFQGGANAGHTVVIGRKTYVLHLVPSGILHPKTKCVIGHGVVVDPIELLKEIQMLREKDIELDGRLFLSDCAHVILPYHKWLESLDAHDVRVGTTKRGIGPAYEQKYARTGIRVYEFIDPDRFRQRLQEHGEVLERVFRGAGVEPPQPIDRAIEEWVDEYSKVADQIRGFVSETMTLLGDAWRRGEKILCEGAQGTLLDVDMGTYPFVTSSTTTAAGAASGLGLPPSAIRKVVGICKAYATRVGEGPFTSELLGSEAEALREQGGEYGATTGRPRRVGWLDLVALRHAVRVNGIQSLVLTKLDVLSGRTTVPVVIAYDGPNGRMTIPPRDPRALDACRPVIEERPGWSDDLSKVRRYPDLPEAVRDYVEWVGEQVECPVGIVSVGSGRNQVIRVPRSRSQVTAPA